MRRKGGQLWLMPTRTELAADVTTEWHWNGVDVDKAREKLDALVKKRGDAVHRSKVSVAGSAIPHLVSTCCLSD
jgi:hypothetical protein